MVVKGIENLEMSIEQAFRFQSILTLDMPDEVFEQYVAGIKLVAKNVGVKPVSVYDFLGDKSTDIVTQCRAERLGAASRGPVERPVKVGPSRKLSSAFDAASLLQQKHHLPE